MERAEPPIPEAVIEQAPPGRWPSRVALWSLIAAAALSPLLVGTTFPVLVQAKPLTSDLFATPKFALLLVLSSVSLFGWLASVLVERRPVRLARPHIALGGFVLLAAVSTALSLHPATAFFGRYSRREGLLAWAAYALLAFLATQMITTLRDLKRLSWALTVGVSFVVLQGAVQYLGYYGRYADAGRYNALLRPFSTLGNTGYLGNLLVLAMPVMLAVALTNHDKVGRLVSWLAFWMTAALWIGLSVRAAWLGGLIALVSVCISAWRKRARPQRVDSIPILIGALTTIGVVAWSAVKPGYFNMAPRVASLANLGERNNASRLLLWEHAVRVIRDHPVVGTGLDTTSLVLPRYETQELLGMLGYNSIADNVHNQVLSILSSVGIPAGILCIAFVVWTLALAGPRVFARRVQSSDGDLLFAAYWAGAVGFLVSVLFSFTTVSTAPVFVVACGLLLVPYAESRPLSVSVLTKRVLLSLSAGVVLAASVLSLTLTIADADVLKGRSTPDHSDRIALFAAATRLAPYQSLYKEDLAAVQAEDFERSVNAGRVEEGALEKAKALFRPAVKSAQDAIDSSPSDFVNHVRLARIYNAAAFVLADATYYDRATDEAREARALAPARAEPLVAEAAALVGRGQSPAAESLLLRALAMNPTFAETYSRLSEIQYQRGDKELALETLVKGGAATGRSDALFARTYTLSSLADVLRSELASDALAP